MRLSAPDLFWSVAALLLVVAAGPSETGGCRNQAGTRVPCLVLAWSRQHFLYIPSQILALGRHTGLNTQIATNIPSDC